MSQPTFSRFSARALLAGLLARNRTNPAERLWPSWATGSGRGSSAAVRRAGKNITLDGCPFRIVGIMPRGFQFMVPAEEVWVPMGGVLNGGRGGFHLMVIARLKSGASLAKAQTGMAAVSDRLAREYPQENRNRTVRVEPLRDRYARALRPALIALMAAVSLLLLIACANVAGCWWLAQRPHDRDGDPPRAGGGDTTYFPSGPDRESPACARWRRLGSPSQSQAARPLCCGSGQNASARTGGCGSIRTRIRPRRLVSDGDTVRHHAGVAAAGHPRIPEARPVASVAGDLRGGTFRSAAGRRGLLIKSFVRLLDLDFGFRAENVLTASLSHTSPNDSAFYPRVLDRVAALPGVRSVGAANFIPINTQSWGQDIYIENGAPRAPGDFIWAGHRSVSLGYFRTIGMRLLQGREFGDQDPRESVSMINARMARTFWGRKPDWQTLQDRGTFGSMDLRHRSGGGHQVFGLEEEAIPEMYFLEFMPRMTLVVRGEKDVAGLAAAIRAVVQVDATSLSPYRSMENIISDSAAPAPDYAPDGFFAAIALVLAGVGLFGLISYSVAQRSHEFGVRVAIGAQRWTFCAEF